MSKLPKMPKMNERQPVMARDVKKFGKELEERTRQFSIKIIRLSSTLPNTPEGRAIRTQMTKAGTSVSANYREANRARSKADFRNKIAICEIILKAIKSLILGILGTLGILLRNKTLIIFF
jgi:hypothetical protein